MMEFDARKRRNSLPDSSWYKSSSSLPCLRYFEQPQSPSRFRYSVIFAVSTHPPWSLRWTLHSSTCEKVSHWTWERDIDITYANVLTLNSANSTLKSFNSLVCLLSSVWPSRQTT